MCAPMHVPSHPFCHGSWGFSSLHLHSGTQAAWRSPIWSTANLCGRERRQSSERLHWLPPESHTRPFPSHGTGESSLRGCTRLQQVTYLLCTTTCAGPLDHLPTDPHLTQPGL